MELNSNAFFPVPKKRWEKIYQGDELDPKQVLDLSGIERTDLASLTGYKVASVRLDRPQLPPAVMERIQEIARVLELAAEYFDSDSERVSTWFLAKNPLLGNSSPRDMLRVGRYEKLLKFLYNSRSGDRIP